MELESDCYKGSMEKKRLNNISSTWSTVAKAHEKKMTQRQKDKAIVYTIENFLLSDPIFRDKIMVTIEEAKRRKALISEDAHQGRKNALASLDDSSSRIEYQTEVLSTDTRKRRLFSDGKKKTTLTKRQSKRNLVTLIE